MVHIAVLGAGMVGLSTAVNVQEVIPEARVTIVADKFDRDTTSSGAGGLFEPSTKLLPGLPVEKVKEWARQSWDYFSSLAMSPLAKETGQTLVSGYLFSDNPQTIQNPPYADLVFNFRVLRPEELKRMKFPYKYGTTFTTVVTHPQKFMPWLMRKFRERGGTVEFRTVKNLGELAGTYDIVMNCSALGSQHLLRDSALYPVKGQMAKVKAPWIKQFIYCDDKTPTYVIPHDDYVLVGGTRDEGEYSADVSPQVQEDILHRVGSLLPQIKAGKIVGNWAGLRPHRDPLRLEKELLVVNGKKLRVVHNYGHGSNGITLSWGTALQAAQIAKEWVNEIPRPAKL